MFGNELIIQIKIETNSYISNRLTFGYDELVYLILPWLYYDVLM